MDIQALFSKTLKVVKIRFLDPASSSMVSKYKEGQLSTKAYTYKTGLDLSVGDLVVVPVSVKHNSEEGTVACKELKIVIVVEVGGVELIPDFNRMYNWVVSKIESEEMALFKERTLLDARALELFYAEQLKEAAIARVEEAKASISPKLQETFDGYFGS